MAKITNTFAQGLDRDSSKNKYDNSHYYDAKNFRIVTQEGLSSGAFENIRGTQYRMDILDNICGDVVLGNYLILWTTDNTGSPNGTSVDRIWKIDIADLEALDGTANVFTLDTDWFHLGGNLIYSGNLGLSTQNLIVSIARYENDSIQKVYWVDGYNRLRHINTIYNADINDLTTLPIDRLEVIGDIELTQPFTVDIVSGNLRAGRIQYVYQLYMVNGSETVFSPASNLINLVNYSDVDATSEEYRGSELDENTGKGVKCSIEIDSSNYTRIRIIAIHYTTLAGDPEIRLIEEREISGSVETIYFTDTGNNLGSYLLEDIRTVGTTLFSAAELETKNNILFPANMTEEYFDFDFDARAYRFGGAETINTEPNYNECTVNASEGDGYNRRNISRVYQEDNSYFLIYGAALTRIGAGGTAAVGDWEYYDYSGSYQSSHPDYDQSGYGTAYGLPVDADAINKFNDLDNDGDHNYRYMYQTDGIVLGGEGPNISYKFKLKEITLDEYPATIQRLYSNLDGSASNPSYDNYASPYNSGRYLGFHRDEIYRFGIVGFDGKGRNSFAKWIGDIRFPSISTLAEDDLYNLGGGSPTYQSGTITIEYVDNVQYKLEIDGVVYIFHNEIYGLTDATMIANALRNIIQMDIGYGGAKGSYVTQTPPVAGVWDITWDLTPGAYTVIEHDSGFYVSYTQTQDYAPDVGALADHSIAWWDGSKIIANILYPEFTVSNLPSEVENYQIVRVKRESLDRTVMGQGIVGGVTSAGIPLNWDDSSSYSEIYTFASPEVAFNKNLARRSNDRLQEVGEFFDNVDIDAYLTDLFTYKYFSVVALSNPQLPETPAGAGSAPGDENDITSKTNIVDGQIVAQNQVEALIGSTTYYINNATNNTDKGIAFVFEAENTSWRSKNKPYTHATDGRKLVNYRRNVFDTQYGGLSYNNRRQNQYIVASDIQTAASSSVNVFGGDTYIGMFDYLYSSWQEGEVTSTQPEVIYIPVETSINLTLRLDECYHYAYNNGYSDYIHENAGVWTNGTNEYPQTNDLYRYNTVYSKENDSKIFIQAPFDWTSETDFPTRVRASELKTLNEYSDSWLNYKANAYIDVEAQYGEITKLITVNERLLFFQPKAFGTLSVNERALIQTGDISQLSLGTSGVLERFDYAKRNMGASDTRHVLLTPNALYWVDTLNKSMYRFTNSPEEISFMQGMDSYFRQALVNGSTTFLFYNPEFKELYLNDYTNNWTLPYNEVTESFTPFIDYYPSYVFNFNDRTYGTRTGDTFLRHDDPYANRGYLYGSYVDSYVTFLINPEGENTCIYNNFEWFTEVTEQSGAEADITYDNIRLWNDYQGDAAAGIALSSSNVKRRMRKWRYTIPRALYEPNGTTLKTVRDARFRDSYLFAKFSYTNDSNDRRFIAHDMITSYTISNK